MALKIKLPKEGERIDPKIMGVLGRFAKHRDQCGVCSEIQKTGCPPCIVGETILREIASHPDCEFVPDEPKNNS